MPKRSDGNTILRYLRVGLAITQRKMAAETGLSAVYLSQVETGEHDIGRDAALKILDVYRPQMATERITLEDLLRGSRDAA